MEDVLVVGAGPTGLTSACELARHGIKARIIDKAAAPSDKSKAFAVHARTLELFENIGVVQAVLDRGRPSTGIAFYDKGELTLLYDLLTGAEHELLMFHGERTSAEGLATLCRIAQDVADRYGPLIELHAIKPGGGPEGGPDVASEHVDVDSTMHRAFGASVASVVLVRPDGYIAFRNQPADPDALASYLASIFTI